MKTMILSVMLCCWAWSLPTAAAATRDADRYFFDQTLGDLSEELQTAREQGKTGILIMFEMEECPFCHRMKTTVLNQIPVQDYFKQHFLIFPMDIEGDVEITDFAGVQLKQKDFAFKRLRIRATPVFAFFNLQGRLVARYTGATTDANEFMLLGRFVVEGAYWTSSFVRYKRAHKPSP